MKYPNKQQGAILVTSLLLLLVLTVIGVSVMQMTRMQERMAGNSRDMNLAFQGAESALRAGENDIMGLSARPSFCVEDPCTSAYDRDVLEPMNNQSKEYWEDMARKLPEGDLTEDLDEQPQFVSEQLAFIRFSSEFDDLNGREFYQVSARSTGGTGNSESVVQSTFARAALN
jgi:type IV pilus assembly protein PilX